MDAKSVIPVSQERSALARASDPFTALRQEIDRLFSDFGRGFPAFGRAFPAFGASDLALRMDMTENDKAIELTAELPGLEEKDVEINFVDDVLTIRGEKASEKDEGDKNYRFVERSYGSFSRSVELPPGVDPAAIKASLSKGVLTVTIPKAAPAVAKKIEVKSAA
ncbi:MAG: Hsp20/alpha crystallin family protein [Roseiarcus sp.]